MTPFLILSRARVKPFLRESITAEHAEYAGRGDEKGGSHWLIDGAMLQSPFSAPANGWLLSDALCLRYLKAVADRILEMQGKAQ